MVVTVTYQDGSTEETTAYSYAPKSRLTKEDKAVTITYTGKDAVADLAATTVEISVKINKRRQQLILQLMYLTVIRVFLYPVQKERYCGMHRSLYTTETAMDSTP